MEKVKQILSIIVLIILTPVLFVSLVILTDSFLHPDEIPSFFGWKPFIVLSGSMETQINVGDLVVVKEVAPQTINSNDVIAFKLENVVVTHRVVEKTTQDGKIEFITKGDNNMSQDNWVVKEEQVEGVYRFKVARLGNLAIFIQTPLGMVVCLSIPLILLEAIQLTDSIKNKKYIKEKEEELEKLKSESDK